MGIESFHNESDETRAWHDLTFAEDSESPSGVARTAGRTLELEPGEEGSIETDTLPKRPVLDDDGAETGEEAFDDPWLKPAGATESPVKRPRRASTDDSSTQGASPQSTEAGEAPTIESQEN